MTHSIDTPTQPPPASGATNVSSTPSTTDVAKDEARNVGQTAAQAGNQVASTAADQAKQVTQETKRQAQDVVQQGRQQLQEQVRTTQQKAGQGLGQMAQQLRSMAEGEQAPPGPAADLVRQAGDKIEQVAGWLQEREPGDLIEEVRSFARRKPGVFLLGAAVAGVVAGRLTTGVVAAHKDSGPSGQQRTGTGSPYPAGSRPTGTNYVAETYVAETYVADTPPAGYATPPSTTTAPTTGYETGTGTTGSVPPPPYGTVPPEDAAVPPTTPAGWDDPARTPGTGQR